MKTLFARLLIVWLILGQAICLCWSHFSSRPPSQLELEYSRNPSAANRAALENELNRTADYESKRTIGIITLLLAVDGMIIGCFWNFGANPGVLKAGEMG